MNWNKSLGLAFLTIAPSSVMMATSCAIAPLTTYLNGGGAYNCSESGGNIGVQFNHDLLPSYVGLAILPANNSSANPANISVNPGTPGLSFISDTFSSSGTLLSAQTELVHFAVSSLTPITSMTFSLINAQVSAGGLGLGAGVVLGQELVCIGGSFTSLPVGLVTSIANGVLATGTYGCNGVTMVGTAAVTAGALNLITGTLGLPSLLGLSDQVTIQLQPADQFFVDVIKIQALVSVLGGSASTGGFSNGFGVAPAASTPEPSTWAMASSALLVFGGLRFRKSRKSRASGLTAPDSNS